MEFRQRKPHVLVFPFPAQGHMIPLLDLAYTLASHGLSITILATPNNEFRLKPILGRADSHGLHIRPLILSLPPTEGIPPECQHMEQLPPHLLPLFIFSLGALAVPLEQWLLQQQQQRAASDGFGPPVCMISDFFLGWTQHTAAKVGIPRVVFYSSGACAMSVTHSLWVHMPHQGLPDSEEGQEVPFLIPDLPLSVWFTKSQISSLVRSYRRSDPVYEFLRDSMTANPKSWGSLINTLYDLEKVFVDHMQRVSVRPVWSVGPLLPAVVFEQEKRAIVTERGKPNSATETLCVQWLDSQKPRSVLYVCFGSQAVLSNTQIQDIAAGLEGIQHGFIWVFRDPPADLPEAELYGKLPKEFEERSKEKGLVIRGWAPQLSILSYSSIGGFLTHCGWNSTLESITMGVPLITWPMTADQHYNSLLIVEHLKNGFKLCPGGATVPDRECLKAAVKRVLGREGEEMKRAEELRKLARAAVNRGGSSYANLEAFVSEMQHLAQF